MLQDAAARRYHVAMALESTSVPLERIRIVVNGNVEDVRRTIAQNTSAYSSVLQGLKVGIAADPNLPFVGMLASDCHIRLPSD